MQISVVVEDEPRDQNPGSSSTSTANLQMQMNEIIAECVEQVLTILREKQER